MLVGLANEGLDDGAHSQLSVDGLVQELEHTVPRVGIVSIILEYGHVSLLVNWLLELASDFIFIRGEFMDVL